MACLLLCRANPVDPQHTTAKAPTHCLSSPFIASPATCIKGSASPSKPKYEGGNGRLQVLWLCVLPVPVPPAGSVPVPVHGRHRAHPGHRLHHRLAALSPLHPAGRLRAAQRFAACRPCLACIANLCLCKSSVRCDAAVLQSVLTYDVSHWWRTGLVSMAPAGVPLGMLGSYMQHGSVQPHWTVARPA